MVKRRYAVIPLWYRSISFYRAYNKRKFVRYENVERKWMQRKLGRALLIIWFSNALRCVALRCVYRTGQACPLVARNASNESKVDSKEIAIDNSWSIIRTRPSFPGAWIFFDTSFRLANGGEWKCCPRDIFHVPPPLHQPYHVPCTPFTIATLLSRDAINNWWQFRGNTSPRSSSVFRSHGELGGRERGVTVKRIET